MPRDNKCSALLEFKLCINARWHFFLHTSNKIQGHLDLCCLWDTSRCCLCQSVPEALSYCFLTLNFYVEMCFRNNHECIQNLKTIKWQSIYILKYKTTIWFHVRNIFMWLKYWKYNLKVLYWLSLGIKITGDLTFSCAFLCLPSLPTMNTWNF